MAKQASATKANPGRPPGITRTQKSITIPTDLLAKATKRCARKNEALSQFASRAMEFLLNEEAAKKSA